MKKPKTVFTNNKGELEVIEPFTFLRGKQTESMGKAKDKEGNVYRIYTASCGLPNCFCGARAQLIKK